MGLGAHCRAPADYGMGKVMAGGEAEPLPALPGSEAEAEADNDTRVPTPAGRQNS